MVETTMNMLQEAERLKIIKFKFKHTVRFINIHFVKALKKKRGKEKLKSLGQRNGNSAAVELVLYINRNKLFSPETY